MAQSLAARSQRAPQRLSSRAIEAQGIANNETRETRELMASTVTRANAVQVTAPRRLQGNHEKYAVA